MFKNYSSTSQGSDSGILAGLRDSPNRTSKNVQKCTESMPISATEFRWGTSTLEANEKLKMYKNVQKCTTIFRWGTGTLSIKQNVQNVQKCTDFYVYFPVGYELFGKYHIFRTHSCVRILHQNLCVTLLRRSFCKG